MLYIANWKMNIPLKKHAMALCHEINTISLQQHDSIVICPSTVHLDTLINQYKDSFLHFGAQDCSEHEQGAYTGQTSALSLAEIGATYCIIGHSERRLYESPLVVSHKLAQLLKTAIIPIICFGESVQEYTTGASTVALEQQLKPLMQSLNTHTVDTPICFAYEPVWAIGTGKTPENSYIVSIFKWLADYIRSQCPIIQKTSFLYGGSVDEKNISQLRSIECLDGFLIGGASLNFQKFKNIVR